MEQNDSAEKPHALAVADVGVVARVRLHQVEQRHLPDLGHKELFLWKCPR